MPAIHNTTGDCRSSKTDSTVSPAPECSPAVASRPASPFVAGRLVPHIRQTSSSADTTESQLGQRGAVPADSGTGYCGDSLMRLGCWGTIHLQSDPVNRRIITNFGAFTIRVHLHLTKWLHQTPSPNHCRRHWLSPAEPSGFRLPAAVNPARHLSIGLEKRTIPGTATALWLDIVYKTS